MNFKGTPQPSAAMTFHFLPHPCRAPLKDENGNDEIFTISL